MNRSEKHRTTADWNINETSVARVSGRDGCSRNAPVQDTFDNLLAELTKTKAALAESVQTLQFAAQRIAELEKTNDRRRSELKHLVRREAQARVFGYHDELTGLANRRLLKDRLRQAMARGARENLYVALVLLDLDDFKRVNDELGQPVGDHVLRIVAARLIAATRGADTACRYGGDEFVVMLPQVEDMRMVHAVAGKLSAAITAPITVDDCEILLTASAGCVVYPDDGETCPDLIEAADRRLYCAKASRTTVAINRPSGRMGGH